MTVMEPWLLVGFQKRKLAQQILERTTTMTELVLCVRADHPKGLSMGADFTHHAGRKRFTGPVQIRRYEDGVETETAFPLNGGGDGPLARTFSNQDLLTVPEGCNSFKRSGTEVFDADNIVVNEVGEQPENTVIPDGRKGIRRVHAREAVQGVHKQARIFNQNHGPVMGQVVHGLSDFGACDGFQINGLRLNNNILFNAQTLDFKAKLLEVVLGFLQLSGVGGQKPNGSVHVGYVVPTAYDHARSVRTGGREKEIL